MLRSLLLPIQRRLRSRPRNRRPRPQERHSLDPRLHTTIAFNYLKRITSVDLIKQLLRSVRFLKPAMLPPPMTPLKSLSNVVASRSNSCSCSCTRTSSNLASSSTPMVRPWQREHPCANARNAAYAPPRARSVGARPNPPQFLCGCTVPCFAARASVYSLRSSNPCSRSYHDPSRLIGLHRRTHASF